ncbi:hypothetical protein GPZ80_29700 [Actinokineospora sp. HBU206404]|uniref:TrbC/VIRB2 family protein n=1 Tax=Actinokineospora xionganensis TaxID=2684470 RepID=A0ABR7LG52_9PSEU|nr:hypothetical protein [Actinokineospora xionganensis]
MPILVRVVAVLILAAVFGSTGYDASAEDLIAQPPPAPGAPASLDQVISNLRWWLVGLLVGLATLFLTIGGIRYLAADGDPGQVEQAKRAMRNALIGYALAVLAPLLVTILRSLVG